MIWEIPSQLHRFSFMIFWYALKAGLINTDILQEENEGRKDHQQQRHDLVNPAQVFFHHKILPNRHRALSDKYIYFQFFFEYLIVEQFCLCIYALASPSRQRMWLNVLPRRRVSFEKRKTLSGDFDKLKINFNAISQEAFWRMCARKMWILSTIRFGGMNHYNPLHCLKPDILMKKNGTRKKTNLRAKQKQNKSTSQTPNQKTLVRCVPTVLFLCCMSSCGIPGCQHVAKAKILNFRLSY